MNTIQIDRFWGNVDVKSNTECWEWKKCKLKNGYGIVKINGKNTLTHRVAFNLFNNWLEIGSIIRHTCDNPPCCNPSHLLSGTVADNVADRVARNRSANGSYNGRSKLKEDQVLEIRNSNLSGIDLSRIYGVSNQAISKIRLRHRWKHLKG